jgi:WD40 repeat protein
MSLFLKRLVFGVGITLVVAFAVWQPVFATEPVAARDKAAPTDGADEPLPPGAIARLPAARIRRDDRVHCAALSPDAKVVAVVVNKNTIRLLDAASAKELRRFPVTALGRRLLAFSPDGSSLAFIDQPGHLRLWDAGTGKEIRRFAPPKDKGGRIVSFAFSADGKTLAAVAERTELVPQIYAWEVATGKELGRFEALQNWQVGVALSADGKVLASWGQQARRGERAKNQQLGRTIQLRDLATGKELRRLQATRAPVQGACFVPRGETLAVVGGDGKIHIWQLAQGKEVRQLAGPDDLGAFLSFSRDGKTLVGVTDSGEIRSWDVATGKPAAGCTAPSGARFHSLAFAPDGKMRALGVDDRQTIWLWEAPTGKHMILGGGHRGGIKDLAFLPDRKSVATAGGGRLCLWDLATSKLDRMVYFERDSFARGISPDGRYLVTGGSREPVQLRAAASAKKIRVIDDYLGVESAVFSGDGAILALSRDDDEVTLWESSTGRALHRLEVPRGPGGSGRAIAFSPDGKTLASATLSHEVTDEGYEVCAVRLFSMKTGKEFRVLKTAGYRRPSLAWSPNGGILAVVGNEVGLWDLASGREVSQMVVGIVTCSPVFAANGRILAIASTDSDSKDAEVELLEVASGKVRATLKGSPRSQGFSYLAFSSDGKLLAAGTYEGTVLIWDMTRLTTVKKWPKGHPSPTELAELWADLSVDDADRGYQAILKLAAAPAEAVALVRKQLQPVPATELDDKGIARLITLLDDDDFAVREDASRQLRRAGAKSRPALLKALKNKPAPEVRRRAEQLLEKLGEPDPPWEMVRPLRALELLEQIATPEAREVLTELAKGKADAQLTREAKATLDRLIKLSGRPKE